MIARVMVASSGTLQLPSPSYAVRLVQLSGAATAYLVAKAQGQLVDDVAIPVAVTIPLQAEGSVTLSGAANPSTWLVMVAQNEHEALVLK